ncbi:hypothetical protein HDU93_001896 [Gonapodya sp. JEL0774]|nr:hypothetical protein HDU93_001896 [Gonapodya sp. JEL0774]
MLLGLEYVYTIWDTEEEKLKLGGRIAELENRLKEARLEKSKLEAEVEQRDPGGSANGASGVCFTDRKG